MVIESNRAAAFVKPPLHVWLCGGDDGDVAGEEARLIPDS